MIVFIDSLIAFIDSFISYVAYMFIGLGIAFIFFCLFMMNYAILKESEESSKPRRTGKRKT